MVLVRGGLQKVLDDENGGDTAPMTDTNANPAFAGPQRLGTRDERKKAMDDMGSRLVERYKDRLKANGGKPVVLNPQDLLGG